MSQVTFVPVRYFTATDVFHYTVDNRPLQDLTSNDVLLQAAIDANYALINRHQPQMLTVTSSFTAPSFSEVTVFANQPLVANITVSANPTPTAGDILRMVRSTSATGAFNLTFNSKSLTTAATTITWQYDGSTWWEIGSGVLV